jgi:2'-5' RNA ligase
LRVFIAALVPEETKLEIRKYLDEIKPHWEGVKWESDEKLHVTLKFLGEVEGLKLEEVENCVGEAVKVYSPFDMEIARFGGFPNLRTPRVLVIGLNGNPELLRLQSEIDERLKGLGFAQDDRSFLPHITVGRVKARAKLRGSLPIPERLPFLISEIAVMKSVLNPGCSKYSPLSLFKLVKADQ